MSNMSPRALLQHSEVGGSATTDKPQKKEGYIRMKKKKTISKWRKRYCILDGPTLTYYDVFVPGVGEENVYRGKIFLETERTDVIGDDLQFTLNTLSGDVYIFQPGNDDDCVAWMKALEQHMLPRRLLEEAHNGYELEGTKEQRKINKLTSENYARSRRSQLDTIQSFDVTVPEGYAPGDKLKVLFKQQHISVVIPTGVYPGETFEVRLQKQPQNFKETIQHAGWLLKTPRNGKGLPNKRWFVLTKSHLHYADQEGLQPKMKWLLKDAKVSKRGSSAIRLEMHDDEILDLGCGSAENAGAWMGRLQLCINQSSQVSTKEVLSEGRELVGEQLSGRPVFAGWLKKHATTGKGIAKSKWFIMTPTHLVYMDWEGAPVKNAWPLKGSSVIKLDKMLEYQIVFSVPMESLSVQLTCETLEDMENWHMKLTEYILKNDNADAKTLLKEEKDRVERSMNMAKKKIRAKNEREITGKMSLPQNHKGATFPLTLRLDSGETIRLQMDMPAGASPGQQLEFFIRCTTADTTDADGRQMQTAENASDQSERKSDAAISELEIDTLSSIPSYVVAAGASSAPGSAERQNRRDQRKQRKQERAQRKSSPQHEANNKQEGVWSTETQPPPTGPPTGQLIDVPQTPQKAAAKPEAAAKPDVDLSSFENADDNDLKAWMQMRGFAAHTEALMSIGVETADDLSLVTYDDLTDLHIEAAMAKKIADEIAKMEE